MHLDDPQHEIQVGSHAESVEISRRHRKTHLLLASQEAVLAVVLVLAQVNPAQVSELVQVCAAVVDGVNSSPDWTRRTTRVCATSTDPRCTATRSWLHAHSLNLDRHRSNFVMWLGLERIIRYTQTAKHFTEARAAYVHA